MPWCNAYGAENPAGQERPAGGFLDQPVTHQWSCKREATHRFRWVCAHDCRGAIVSLCEPCWRKLSRQDVQFCPRCNTQDDHKCPVRLVSVS
jgi:hypothetical protein